MMETIREIAALLVAPKSELRQIIALTLSVSAMSTFLSVCLGVPLGCWLGITQFKGKKLVMRVAHTFLGLPPVVAGLFVFFLLSRSGPLGQFKLLYSPAAMVTAQVLIIFPVATALSADIVGPCARATRETVSGIGLPHARRLLYTLYECRRQLFAILFVGFGRAISEVGAAQLVGGNIQYKTRVMTTAIVLETNRGDFQLAAALGVLLLLLAFLVTSLAQFFEEGSRGRT